MKIVQADQVDFNTASIHREGATSRQQFFDGPTGVENYSLVIARAGARYSPRHRHNFEQYRHHLDGAAEYGKTGTLKPSMLGYFPEGIPYGPQTQSADGKEQTVLALLEVM